MSPTTNNFSVDDVENSLCQIDEVKAARVILGPERNIAEIHVLAAASKHPKQLSRDIESLLMARYHLPVDHKKISIAQINDQGIDTTTIRPKLVSVKHEISGRKAWVEVVLEYKGEEYIGSEQGPISRSGSLRLVAMAALAALEKMIPDGYSLALEDITALNLGRDMAVIVSIAILSLRGDENLVGCSLVRGDERETIVRAVLDAVNRRLGFLITA